MEILCILTLNIELCQKVDDMNKQRDQKEILPKSISWSIVTAHRKLCKIIQITSRLEHQNNNFPEGIMLSLDTFLRNTY